MLVVVILFCLFLLTLFVVPSYCRLVNGPECDMGVVCGDVTITYKMIQQDIRAAMHWVHTEVSDFAICVNAVGALMEQVL